MSSSPAHPPAAAAAGLSIDTASNASAAASKPNGISSLATAQDGAPPSASAQAPVVAAASAPAPPVVADDAPHFHTPSDSSPSADGATVPAAATSHSPAAAAVAAPAAPSRAELDQAIQVLSEGARFLRYPSTNPSDAVAIQLFAAPMPASASPASAAAHADGPQQPTQPLALWWCDAFDPSRPKTPGDCIPFSALRDLFKGAMSDPLRSAIAAHSKGRHSVESGVRDEVCFVLQSRAHVLSLQAESPAVRDAWIRMICTVLEAALHKQRVVSTGFATAAAPPPPQQARPGMTRKPSSMQGRALLSTPTGHTKLAHVSTSATLNAPSASLHALATEKAQLIHSVQLTLIQMVKEAETMLLKDSAPTPSAQEFERVLKHRSDAFHLIPQHLLQRDKESFEAKSYAPTIFARMRRLYGIRPEAFLASVAHPTKGYNDLIVNSKSGSFFFYTHDNTFLLKSCTEAENKLLCSHMLRSYYAHHVANPNTMLSQILGAFRLVVERPHKQRVHFFLMRNVFASPPERPIHVRFDLKGSSYGRRAKPQELQQPVPVLKDQDFFDGVTFPDGRVLPPTFLHLGDKRERFLAQLQKDAEYLRSNEVMDYSLLVGIHFTHRHEQEQEEAEKASQSRKQSGADATASPATAAAAAAASTGKAATAADGVAAGGDSSSDDDDDDDDDDQRGGGGSASAPPIVAAAAVDSSGVSSALPLVSVMRSSSEGVVAKQTNYGLKPQKEVLIPRNMLRKASLALMDDQQRAAIREAVADKPSNAPSSPASAPAVPAASSGAASSSSASSSSSSAGPVRGSLRVPPAPTIISPRGDLFESDGTIVSQADSSGAKDGDEIYYLGVIDILQQYTSLKKLEHSLKSSLFGSDAVSCADPYFYETRFLRRIGPHCRGGDHDEPADVAAAKAARGAGQQDEEREDLELERREEAAEQAVLRMQKGLPPPSLQTDGEEKQTDAHRAATKLAPPPPHSWPALSPLPEGADEANASASPSPLIAPVQPTAVPPADMESALAVPMELTPLTPVAHDRNGFITVDAVRVA